MAKRKHREDLVVSITNTARQKLDVLAVGEVGESGLFVPTAVKLREWTLYKKDEPKIKEVNVSLGKCQTLASSVHKILTTANDTIDNKREQENQEEHEQRRAA
jgi:hypothetical protein